MKNRFIIFTCYLLCACQTVPLGQSASVNTNIENNTSLSAKCLARLANTEARSLISLSPSLSASLDEEGDATASLRLDLIDFHRAGLNREATLANCRQDESLNIARALVRLTAGRIAHNSHIARARKITAGAKKLEREINAMHASGQLKQAALGKLSKSVRNLRKQAQRSQQRASTLAVMDFDAIPTFEEIETELLLNLADIQENERTVEFYRNIRFNVSGGIRYSEADDDIDVQDEDEFESFANLSLTMNLGVFDPRFRNQQARLYDAELEELNEAQTGILWQLQNLYQQNLIAEQFLIRERGGIIMEIAALKDSLRNQEKPEKQLVTKASLVLANAELVRININLKELRIILGKLSGSQNHG